MKMKIAELTQLTSEELETKLTQFRRQLLDLRMQAASGKLDKAHRILFLRRQVAQALTLQQISRAKGEKKGKG